MSSPDIVLDGHEPRVSPDVLRSFARAVLLRLGMSEVDAAMAADAMVWSDLRGAPTKGVPVRLAQAAARIGSGAANPTPRWNVVSETEATTVLDAEGGWGQVAGTRGMRLAGAKARRGGVGITSVRNCDATAALGWYAHVAVDESLIGLAITNTMPLMPPWLGTVKLLGNQAFATGTPAGRHPPILFDSALTVMSNSGIKAAQRELRPLPVGAALDADGAPTIDPAAALAGVMLPAGGHRGYGLALMWEVLTGVLGGGRMAPDVGSSGDLDGPMGTTLFCLAIDPSAFLPFDTFVARVDALIDEIHGSPPAPGVERVRVPGERGYQLAAEQQRLGIAFDPSHLERIREVGASVGVRWETFMDDGA